MDEVDFIKGLDKLKQEYLDDYYETLRFIGKMEARNEIRIINLKLEIEKAIDDRLVKSHEQEASK